MNIIGGWRFPFVRHGFPPFQSIVREPGSYALDILSVIPQCPRINEPRHWAQDT